MEIARPQSKQPMPPHAQKVFKGKIFDVYQWEQEGFDGKVRVFEKVSRPDSAKIIPVLPDGSIVISQQEQPLKGSYTALFGGRVDIGESATIAAQRELREEAGLESTDWFLYSSAQPYSKLDWAFYIFIARNCFRVAEQDLDGAEKISLITVSFEEFVEKLAQGDCGIPSLTIEALRAKLDPQKMQELKNKILNP